MKFYYWEHFKAKDQYVEGKYIDLKDEIMNNKIYAMTKTKYEHMLRKTSKMMRTQYAKSLKADYVKDHHYGIDKGTPFKLDNMLAIVLYVDNILVFSKNPRKVMDEI